jgi:hypothetical protein
MGGNSKQGSNNPPAISEDETFWRLWTFPEEDRYLFTSQPWTPRDGWRWFRSPNVVCLEQWRWKRRKQG